MNASLENMIKPIRSELNASTTFFSSNFSFSNREGCTSNAFIDSLRSTQTKMSLPTDLISRVVSPKEGPSSAPSIMRKYSVRMVNLINHLLIGILSRDLMRVRRTTYRMYRAAKTAMITSSNVSKEYAQVISGPKIHIPFILPNEKLLLLTNFKDKWYVDNFNCLEL